MSRSRLLEEPPLPPGTWRRFFRRFSDKARRLLILPQQTLKLRKLRTAYKQGLSSRVSAREPEPPDETILARGELLRAKLLAEYEGKYRQDSWRVLMAPPSSISGHLWFEGIRTGLRHAGIECHFLGSDTSESFAEALEAFQPNVFVALEAPTALRSLDLDYLRRYKRSTECLRLFVPVSRAGMPGSITSCREDEWRFELRRRDLTADALFSIFEPDFYEKFVRDPNGPEIDFVTVPQACNPFEEFPQRTNRAHDYFMAASLTPERLDSTWRYIKPIMSRHRGLWGGARWGFGRGPIEPKAMPTCYASSKIALSPLAGFVATHTPELTHRVFAAAGCGAFQLTTQTAIADRFFQADELIQADSPEQFSALFSHYVDRPEERNDIALRALHRVYKAHTCLHRVDRLVRRWESWRHAGLF